MKLALLFSLTALSLVAQEPPKPTEPAKQSEPEKAAPQAPKADPHAGHNHGAPKALEKKIDRVIALVDGEVVMQSDLDAVLEQVPSQQRMQLEMNPQAKAQYEKAYLDSRILAANARKEGLDKSPAFRRKVEQAVEQLLATELVMRDGKTLEEKAVVKDEDLKAYFEKNQDKFKTPDKYSARHILVSTTPGTGQDKGRTEAEAKARIALIQEELKKGRKLEDLAKDYSDDPGSKDRGGLYEDFDPAGMVAEFAEAVRTQELAKVGAPVKTKYGIHLVEVLKKTPAAVPAFDTVKEQVRQMMTPERRQQVWQAYLDGLKQNVVFKTGAEAEAAAKTLPKAGAPKAPKAAKTPKGTK